MVESEDLLSPSSLDSSIRISESDDQHFQTTPAKVTFFIAEIKYLIKH